MVGDSSAVDGLCMGLQTSKEIVLQHQMPSMTLGAALQKCPAAPVEGCTIPAVPPMPRTLCGTLGRTPPMGIRQYSSSSTLL